MSNMLTMKRHKHAVIYLTLSFLFSSCSGRSNEKLGQRLIAAVEQKLHNSQQVLITIKDYTDFRWDRFHVFGPYTTPEEVHNSLGFSWPEYERTAVRHNDHHDLLVFVSDSRVVEYVEYPREHGDFYKLNNPAGYTAEGAVFEVKIEDRGIPIPVPEEK